MTLIIMGEEEREFVDSLLEAAYKDIQDYLKFEEISQVFEVMDESLIRLKDVL